MAQDRFINITLDPNVNAAGHADHSTDNHGKGMGSAAANDLTISYDSAKFTSASVFKSAVRGAIEIAAQSMKQ